MTRFVLSFFVLTVGMFGANITPDFTGVPTGWTTDRFQPNGFMDIGSFQGRSNVLEINVSEAQGFGSRGGGFDFTFYNTQGMQHVVAGGAGDMISADLWLPSHWATEVNGSRRTDIWAVMTDGSSVTDYPILGFTNYGVSAGTFRAWDGASWVNFTEPVLYDSWNTLSILFTGTSYEYRVNEVLVFTDTTVNGSTAFSALIMQAYNFNGDPSIVGAVTATGMGSYSAYWSNTTSGDVPEPGTLAFCAAGLALILVSRRGR